MKLHAALILTTLLACSASAFAQTIGIHVTKRRRVKWYRKAAEQGNAVAEEPRSHVRRAARCQLRTATLSPP
jgi:ribosomal protein L13E